VGGAAEVPPIPFARTLTNGMGPKVAYFIKIKYENIAILKNNMYLCIKEPLTLSHRHDGHEL